MIAADGNICDTDRIMFVRAHLTQLQRATAEGVPVNGYFYWSAMDNLEWTAGFGNRFGSDKRRAALADGCTLLAASLGRAQAVFEEVHVVLRPEDDPAEND